MFISVHSLVIMGIGTLVTIFFLIMLITSGKYDMYLETLDSKEYPFFQLYGVGFRINDLIGMDFSRKSERKRRQHLALLKGDQLAEYYLRVNAAERTTFASLCIVASFILYGISQEIMILVILIGFGALAYYYVSTIPEETVKKRTGAILDEFADVVSKLALLVNAGMILREAWEMIAYSGEGELYDEMRLVCENINNGMSEIDAYTEFGTRCTAPEIKKFTSTIIQGVVKGNKELVEMIKMQSREMWNSKQHRVRQQGEKAASKLLIPTCIMFVGVLIMIIVPIFANLGV
jgi:tight adherence protein C